MRNAKLGWRSFRTSVTITVNPLSGQALICSTVMQLMFECVSECGLAAGIISPSHLLTKAEPDEPRFI